MNAEGTFPLLDLIAEKRSRRSGDGAATSRPDIFDLPSLRALSCEQAEGYYRVGAEPSSRPLNCPGCGAAGKRLHRHDARRQSVKDIPMRGKRVLIQLTRYRYKCQECGQVSQQQLDGINFKRGITTRLEEYIERESLRIDKSFRMVADEVGVDEKTVRNLFTGHIKRLARSWRFEAPRCLGVDEVYIAGVARCVLTDVDDHGLVNILKKRDILSLRRHLLQIKRPERVECVLIDMWRPYLVEVRKRFLRAVVVIDKYHVLRLATDAVMAVRKKLRAGDRRLRMPKAHLLRKRKHTLPESQRNLLEKRLAELPDLAAAHALKEEFFNVWNILDRREAAARLDEWAAGIPEHLRFAFSNLLTALGNWREEILNYFDYPITNAFTESINNIIKSMQRNGRGYTFDVLRAKLVYGSPFVTRRPPRPPTVPKEISPNRRKRGGKKQVRGNGKASPGSNVRQLERIRRSEDEFIGLMRPPEGYVRRFEHFKQLDFDFYDTDCVREEI